MIYAAIFFLVCCCGLLIQVLSLLDEKKHLGIDLSFERRVRRQVQVEVEELEAVIWKERSHSRRLLEEPAYRHIYEKEVIERVYADFVRRRAARLKREEEVEAASLHERRLVEDEAYAAAWHAARARERAAAQELGRKQAEAAEADERRRRADEAAVYATMFIGSADFGGGDSGCGDGGACGDGGGGGD